LIEEWQTGRNGGLWHITVPASDTIIICVYIIFIHLFSPRKRGSMFLPALVCLSVCLSVTMITKKIVDGFVPNFMGRILDGKGNPSSCFVTIGRGMWK